MRTGSKVVCVDDRFKPELMLYYNCLPIEGRVYVVREMGVGLSATGEEGEIVVYLEGMENPRSTKPPHPERGFAEWRFREIESPQEAETKEEMTELAILGIGSLGLPNTFETTFETTFGTSFGTSFKTTFKTLITLLHIHKTTQMPRIAILTIFLTPTPPKEPKEKYHKSNEQSTSQRQRKTHRNGT